MRSAEDIINDLDPQLFEAEQLDMLATCLRILGDYVRAPSVRDTPWMVPVSAEEIAQLTVAIALATPGVPSLEVALISFKFSACNDYREFTAWLIRESAYILLHYLHLKMVGAAAENVDDSALKEALVRRDAGAVILQLTSYLRARDHFWAHHLIDDDAAQRRDEDETPLPDNWLDEAWWKATFDLLALDLTPYLPALPAQAD